MFRIQQRGSGQREAPRKSRNIPTSTTPTGKHTRKWVVCTIGSDLKLIIFSRAPSLRPMRCGSWKVRVTQAVSTKSSPTRRPTSLRSDSGAERQTTASPASLNSVLHRERFALSNKKIHRQSGPTSMARNRYQMNPAPGMGSHTAFHTFERTWQPLKQKHS